MRKIIFVIIIFVSFFFTSCIVINYSKSWVTATENVNFHQYANDTIPLVSIRLHRKIRFIPTAPIMFKIETKQYGFELDFYNKKPIFKTLDSLRYSITDSTKNKSASGTLIINGVVKEYKFENGAPYYRFGCETTYNINVVLGRKNIIKGDFIFLRRTANHRLCSCNLAGWKRVFPESSVPSH